MAGGTIYKKTIASSVDQGTEDNNLIIDAKHAYQVPFSFGSDWNEINIGVFLSFVSGDSLNSGFNSGEAPKDSGGSTNDTFSWIGITKNAHTKSLPLDLINGGFVGYRGNNIALENSTGLNYNKLMNDFPTGNAEGIATHGRYVLSSGEILPSGLDSPNQGAIICVGLNDSESFYADTESTGNFCSYFGIKYTAINKGIPAQKIKMQMCQASNTDPHIGNSDHIFSNPSSAQLNILLDKTQVIGDYTNNMTGLPFYDPDNPSTAIDLPDSFFFYNGVDQTANQDIKPRIHAWSVKKIS